MRVRVQLPIVLLGIIMVLNPPARGAGKGRSASGPSSIEEPRTSKTEVRAAALARGGNLILLNGKIWTGEPMAIGVPHAPPARFAEAVAIANGRVLAVGTDKEIQRYISSGAEVIDLHGRFAMPGFIDGHAHFLDGSFQLLEVNLKHTRSVGEFVERIAQKARSMPPGRWILGGNWDEETWPDENLPTRWMIDAVTPNNPALVDRYDGHACLANSLALKMAGITKATTAPPGGVIVRDAKTNEPTGVLKDDAQSLVWKIIPNPSQPETEEALRAGLADARRLGVTSIEDMNLGSNSPDGTFLGELRLLRRAELEGWLTCRFYEIIPVLDWQRLADAGLSHNMGDEFIKLGAVKAFADGSLGSRTAWMDEPYADDPANLGLPMPLMNPPSQMESLGREASTAGIQTAIHAIGTRANHEVLNIYETVGGTNPAAYRFRIEHAQHLRPDDIPRFGKLGVVASMQPYHAIDDGRWAERRIGPERARSSYAWRSILDAGAPLAFGTDWPVAPLNPLLGIYAAVTRATLDGKHPGGWIPEQKITLDEALRAYTQGSAFAAFEENDKGTIAPGKLGDIVVLSDDLFSIPPEEIKDVHVALTILGGRVVYRK